MDVLWCLALISTVVFGLVGAFYSYWLYLRRNNYWSDKNIPFDAPIPILGKAAAFITKKTYYETDEDHYKKYGRVFGAYVGTSPSIYVGDPDILKLILVKDFNVFSSRRQFKSGEPLLDNMVSALKGEEQWRNIRNTMTPAFSSGKLKKMIPLLCECAKISLENFRSKADTKKGIDCKSLFGNYALDVIASVAFGTELNSFKDENNLFIKNAKSLSMKFTWKTALIVTAPRIARLLGMSFFSKDSMVFFKNMTLAIVERREKAKEVRNDFLQIMMDSMKEGSVVENVEDLEKDSSLKENKSEKAVHSVDQIKRKPLTVDEFLAQTILFFFAGYDTSSTALTLLTYYFALNPDKQSKAQEEIDRIWKDRTELDADAVYEAKYLSAAVDEALRIAPPGTKLCRTANRDYELPELGVTIKKNMTVEVPVFAMHRDPEFFPEPEKFIPERFLEENKGSIKPYSYIPFGAGPRNCVAMRLALLEVKICLIYLLRDVSFTKCAETEIPLEYINASLLQPKSVTLCVTKRQRPSNKN